MPTKSPIEDLLVVSCHIGIFHASTVSMLPWAPGIARREVFFANDVAVLPRAAARGWQAISLASRLPISNSSLWSSLQSKYVKFLQFLNADRDGYASVKRVIYFDDKESPSAGHLKRLLALGEGCDVTIRRTPRNKSTVWEEAEDALSQERYRLNMPQTVSWVIRSIGHLRNGSISSNVMVVNTGLILYANLTQTVARLATPVYRHTQQLRQPECQIV